LYVAVFLYLIVGWARIKKTVLTANTPHTKVSVLIAARNEEAGIHLTIDDILAQDYPKELTEFIIVDDHSTDRTSEIISSYADQGVKLMQLREDKPLNSYKKKAIAMAIDHSDCELIVATDADCRMGTKWLSTIVNVYEKEHYVMISSPVCYFEEQSFFERMQTLEFSYLIGMGAAFIGNRNASNCNGANLAYQKETFYAVGGFRGIDDLASGDDELLLQKIAVQYPGKIGFLKNENAIVYTHAKPNINEFIQQRRRWASKSVKYKNKAVVALALGIWFFNWSLLINALMGFVNVYFFKLFLVQFAIKLFLEFIYGLPIFSFFKRRGLAALIIFSSPLHTLYLIYIGLIGNNRTYVWKDRVVK